MLLSYFYPDTGGFWGIKTLKNFYRHFLGPPSEDESSMTENTEPQHVESMTEFERKLWDLFIFSKRILGYDQISKLHMEWFETLLKNQFILLLAPRGHLKSTTISICYALWRLVQDHNTRILIVNETLSNARNFLREIKSHLIENPRFRSKYGAWDMTASKWSEDSVVIPRTRISKEASLSVGGVLGNLVSLHNDIIIADDPVSDKNSYTPHQRQKLLNWFRSVILPSLEPNGQLILTGTRWHSDDLYNHILHDPGFNHWTKIVEAAETRDEDGTRHVLFPERFTLEKLDQLHNTMGSSSYFCQMLNDVSGQAGSDFRIEWLRSCRYTERPKDMAIYCGVDLAVGVRERNSRFAYAVIGIPRGEKDAFILDAHRDRLSFPDQVKAIKRLCHVHRPNLIVVETNAFQQSMIQVLRTDEEASRMPVKGVTTQGDPQRRIKSLAPLLENGSLRLPDNLPDLEEEFLNFPMGSDDLLDAVWLALQGVQIQRTEPRVLFTDDLDQVVA